MARVNRNDASLRDRDGQVLEPAFQGVNTRVKPDEMGCIAMLRLPHSASPTIMLRITDGTLHMHRAFNEFPRAVRSAEAYAGAGFKVAMISATGRFLMAFEPRGQRTPA